MKIISSLFFLVMLALLSGCGNSLSRVDYYQNLIRAELKVGDSAYKVEAFFKRHNWEYSFYDDTNHQFANYKCKYYFSRVYDERNIPGIRLVAKSIDMHIFLDDDMKFKDFLVDAFGTSF